MSTQKPPPARAATPLLTRERVLVLVLAVATACIFYLVYAIAAPFVPALAWALSLAIVAYPLYGALARRLKRPSIAAALGVVIVTATLVIPMGLVARLIVKEAVAGVESARAGIADGRWRAAVEANPKVAPVFEWLERELDLPAQLERFGQNLVEGARALIGGSVYVIGGWLITLFLLFYFFRDCGQMLTTLRGLLPLSAREADRIFRSVRDTVHAIVYGTVAVAVVQGVLGGLMFWWLGLPAPLLWGAVMAFLAILPVMGAAIVWVPAAAYLALQGEWQHALLLAAWGGIVIALIDNLLYPILVKGKLRLHTVPVFIAILGGLFVFGGAGIVIGPLILAVAVALIETWRSRIAQGDGAETPD